MKFVWSNLWSVSPRKADAIMPLVIKSTRHQDNSAPPRQRIPMSVSNPTCSRQCCQCWICPFLGPTYLDFHKSTPKESKKYSLYRFPQRWTLHLGMKQCPIEIPHSAMVVREWACVIILDACVRLIRRNIIYIYSDIRRHAQNKNDSFLSPIPQKYTQIETEFQLNNHELGLPNCQTNPKTP